MHTRKVSVTVGYHGRGADQGELKTSIDVVKEMAHEVDVEYMHYLFSLKVEVAFEGKNIVKVYK